MSELVCCCCMFFRGKRLLRLRCLIFGLVMTATFAGLTHGQDDRKVPISFLPPPLENATYSLGIYEAKSGKLVRRLQEIAPESAFTVGLNGLMTSWDGKDDEGKAVAPGHYAVRGYAVGPTEVKGVAVLGNDWVQDAETLRVKGVLDIAMVPADEGLAAVVKVGEHYELVRYAGADGTLMWHQPVGVGLKFPQTRMNPSRLCSLVARDDILVVNSIRHQNWACRASDGENIATSTDSSVAVDEKPVTSSIGKDGTLWKIEDGVLVQTSPSGEILRRLTQAADEPKPDEVVASSKSERLYVIEMYGAIQRVRGLKWIANKEENGKQISTWQTFFERSIFPSDPALGLEPAEMAHLPSPVMEVTPVDNPLSPGRPKKIKLTATFDEKGSYLVTGDSLRLRQISQQTFLRAVKLITNKTASGFTFFQTDGAAWDEFSIQGAKNMMEFDAGEFEMTAEGEKAHTEKPAEPPDL